MVPVFASLTKRVSAYYLRSEFLSVRLKKAFFQLIGRAKENSEIATEMIFVATILIGIATEKSETVTEMVFVATPLMGIATEESETAKEMVFVATPLMGIAKEM